ncbi:TerB family tellurite resistance protein [Inmirania thermothiophila]|uniref:Putative tellurite resistance protein B-like protein n=1 Tax=Inmirania thermothiophila TaxID=1750597 RepID=A0A3N1Y783_9GAMM|nr:TerB family tellurite resistance protein [Inmirania thermothiophila]ROR34610.1 putative tellurite resistance protein B-like protein [Inmirania thermothiophila]
MLSRLRRIFVPEEAAAEGLDAERRLRLAAAVLLAETARADLDIAEAERRALAALVARTFGLDAGEAAALVEEAVAAAESAVSLYEHTALVNAHWSPQERARLIGLMWRVAYADGRIDRYEEHIIRRVAELLHVPHAAFIQAKLEAAGEGPAGG